MRHRLLLLIVGLLSALPLQAQDIPPHQAVVSIIIDDLGDRLHDGLHAIDLPGNLTYSILPQTPFARRLAEHAHAMNKEVMLHLPMAAEQNRALGPGGLIPGMSRAEFTRQIQADVAAVPYIRGINNHMGSLLTRDSRLMNWFMQSMAQRGNLFFVDSRTTAESTALTQAIRNGIASVGRDIFLDHEIEPVAIQHQWHRMLQLAYETGSAVAIGHPYPETMAFLAEQLPTLEQQGIRLIPVSHLIQLRAQRRHTKWQLSSSHWPKVAKNSKPSPSSTCCDAPASM